MRKKKKILRMVRLCDGTLLLFFVVVRLNLFLLAFFSLPPLCDKSAI